MPIIEDTQLGKDIRSGRMESCYFLYGKERLAMDKAVSAILRRVTGAKEESLSVTRLDEKNAVGEISDAVTAVSFLTGAKCTVVRDFPLAQRDEREVALLLETVASAVPESVLIFYYPEHQPEVNAAKVKQIIAAFAKRGSVVRFDRKDELSQRRQVQELCRKNGVTIEAPYADELVARFGADGYQMKNEVEKLIAYALSKAEEGAVITAADIDLLCADTVENTVFDLTGAISSGNSRRVFGLLERLFVQRIEPLSITGALNVSLTDLYRARLALDAGVSAKQMATDFSYPPKREFVVARSLARAERYSAKQLRQCFAILFETNGLLMSSKADGRLLIERMIGRMLLVMSGVRR